MDTIFPRYNFSDGTFFDDWVYFIRFFNFFVLQEGESSSKKKQEGESFTWWPDMASRQADLGWHG